MRKPRIPKPKSIVSGKTKKVSFKTNVGELVEFHAAHPPKVKVSKPKVGSVANALKAAAKPKSVSIKF